MLKLSPVRRRSCWDMARTSPLVTLADQAAKICRRVFGFIGRDGGQKLRVDGGVNRKAGRCVARPLPV